jgi:hypothetical protein
VVLKALAFDGRGENKDAYDLMYVLQNYGDGIADVFHRLEPLLADASVQKAITILERDFVAVDSVGPLRLAEFLGEPDNANVRADASGAVRSLLGHCRKNP